MDQLSEEATRQGYLRLFGHMLATVLRGVFGVLVILALYRVGLGRIRGIGMCPALRLFQPQLSSAQAYFGFRLEDLNIDKNVLKYAFRC